MSFYTALTGLKGAQQDISTTSNNIANVGSTGFKKSRTEFGDIFGTTPLQTNVVGAGTATKSITQQFSQGNITQSTNTLDMAISGQGFFALKSAGNPGQVVYTRNGAFSTNADGVLTTSSGYVVQPEIAIPDGVSQINISRDGIISVLVAGANGAEAVGQLQLADFTNRTGLQPIGESFFVQTDTSGDPVINVPQGDGMGRLIQGAVEASNVNVVTELVEMIETQRAYEVSSKSITSVDEMLRFISQNL